MKFRAKFGSRLVGSVAVGLLAVNSPLVSAFVDSSDSPACHSFKSANASIMVTIDAGCLSCDATNAGKAIDGSTQTYASVTVPHALPTMGVAVRATAQEGTTFPPGQNAGVFYSVPAGIAQSYNISVRTLLAGVVRETNNGDNSGGGSGVSGGHGMSFAGIKTTKAFDAVEIFVNNNQANPDPIFKVGEICSNYD